MSRTTWRVLRTELLRGAAPVAAVGVLLAGLFLMYDSAPEWSGRWMSFAVKMRQSLFMLGAVVVMAAAWQAGRERRRRIGEQLTSAARPGWQPYVVAWAAVTLGALAAVLVIVLVGGAFIAPVASYAGGGWWWVLAITMPAMAALSAAGAAAGRLIPSRLVGPVAGIVTFALMVVMLDETTLWRFRHLSPALAFYSGAGSTPDGWLTVYQLLWFAGLAGMALVVFAARRKWLAVVPAAVALLGAAPLVSEPVRDWQPDLAALELVCTEDAGPEVCVTKVNAFLLDDVTEPAREVLARWSGVPRGPTRAVDSLVSWDPQWAEGESLEPNDLSKTGLLLELGSAATLTGELARHDDGMGIVEWWPAMACADIPDLDDSLVEVVGAWGSGNQPVWLTREQRALFDALAGMPEAEQKAWFVSYLEAATDCDQEVLAELAEELA